LSQILGAVGVETPASGWRGRADVVDDEVESACV
jgi:hypothetical protein